MHARFAFHAGAAVISSYAHVHFAVSNVTTFALAVAAAVTDACSTTARIAMLLTLEPSVHTFATSVLGTSNR